MPNWCFTKITIRSSSEDGGRLKELYDNLEKWTSKNYMDNGFGNNWLGNIVLGSGIGTIDSKSETSVRCRGSLQYLDYCNEEIVIDTETAWVPMLGMWKKLIDKYIPDAEIIFRAEEFGCDVCCSNDPCEVGKYVIDSWNDSIESNFDANEHDVREIAKQLLGHDEKSIDELINEIVFGDFDISIHEIEYASIDDFL